MRSAHKAHQDHLQHELAEQIRAAAKWTRHSAIDLRWITEKSEEWQMLTKSRRNYIIGLIDGLTAVDGYSVVKREEAR